MSPPILQTLPEELIDSILRFVDHHATLHTLCLVSRDFNRIATPHLYYSITITTSGFAHLRPLALLLWTSPCHRSAVHSFSVRRAYGGNLLPWPSASSSDNNDDFDVDDAITAQIELYVRESERALWFEQVRHGKAATPIASLLLRSLPHVREMQFDGFRLVDPGVERGLEMPKKKGFGKKL